MKQVRAILAEDLEVKEDDLKAHKALIRTVVDKVGPTGSTYLLLDAFNGRYYPDAVRVITCVPCCRQVIMELGSAGDEQQGSPAAEKPKEKKRKKESDASKNAKQDSGDDDKAATAGKPGFATCVLSWREPFKSPTAPRHIPILVCHTPYALINPNVDCSGPPVREPSKKLQRLKDICRRAGVNPPPSIFKRTATNGEVIAMLTEWMSSKHGLHSGSSTEEIAAVKARNELAKDLEGEHEVEDSVYQRTSAAPSMCAFHHLRALTLAICAQASIPATSWEGGDELRPHAPSTTGA